MSGHFGARGKRGSVGSRLAAASLFACATGLVAANVSAADRNAAPITIVVPFAAATATDVAARYIGQKITESTGRAVVVDNRPGANGIIGIQTAKSLPSSANVILMTSNTTQAANPSLFKDLPYDPVADFKPITTITIGGVLLVVNPASGIKNVSELVEAAKKNPGKLTFGSGNSTSQAGGEMLKQAAGIDILYVPYKSSPAAMADLMGGQIDMAFSDPISVKPLIAAGRLRAIGVTATKRIPGFDDVPTLQEEGLKDYDLSGWIAAYTPSTASDEQVQSYSKLIVDILKLKESEAFFGERGWRVVADSPSALASFQQAETARWKTLVEASGMKVN
ncbi:Bug family tripartite tricarboxylate transporter substrate binding protein [Bordetella bronchiseptica]|uniref:Bug family tripartite tricarboxylate transporter substrate binding protein n=1 Tax=Bordetella bronchiseptica TaxID=518 RepID=UPI0012451B67|nr:tripartite tricarboxylate transporter substrate binding protein [Bordetella bronchiseptica]KAB1447479.1 tripartite tricarboxylate transporter substrate binding protein [Bordetella bronchiseptica]KAB1573912.1 tripartite tricarboxylate transporter substrate binding protein [Bordetella bronchiseptica]